ncbi:MAG: ATP-binding protein [Sedimentisphaerales bacterium]|nr:ATP-binding protein [Sedimentisphaerales bacterium]
MLKAREDRQLQRLLNQFEKQDLLILDELRYVPFSKAGSELLFERWSVEPMSVRA